MGKKILALITAISLMGAMSAAATIVNDDKDIQVLEDQKMVIESLKKFVDDSPTAADEMQYVIQKKEDAARQKMNSMLEQMAKTSSDNNKEDALTGGSLDYVTQKLNLALSYFYESKYWLTIEECNNVIKVSPKNSMAWMRRGSAFYMQGNYEQAKKDWELALGLKPKKSDRADLERFLAKVDSLIAEDKD